MWKLPKYGCAVTTQDTSDRSTSLPHLALSAHAHNREGMLRTDPDWLAARWADAATKVLVVSGTRIRPVDGAADWVAPEGLPDGVRVLLGERDGVTRFALICDPATAPGSGRSGSACAPSSRISARAARTRRPGSSTRSVWPSGTGPPGSVRGAPAPSSLCTQDTSSGARRAARPSSRAPTPR